MKYCEGKISNLIHFSILLFSLKQNSPIKIKMIEMKMYKENKAKIYCLLYLYTVQSMEHVVIKSYKYKITVIISVASG